MATPEHQFIAESFDQCLQDFSATALIGMTESQRRTFDYSCILKRDLSRPLVAQVLWAHSEGLEKDMRTLLHDSDAVLKVLFVKDSANTRTRLDEIIQSYRSKDVLRPLLQGLRPIFLPPDFDADKDREQQWMNRYIAEKVADDILFNVVFGRFTMSDFLAFSHHGGIFGLKYAILHEITTNGLGHMPTFKKRLGYSTTGSIREALIMLSVTGLSDKIPGSNIHGASIKGRLMLDLTRRLLYEWGTCNSWTDELKVLFSCLGVPLPEFASDLDSLPQATLLANPIWLNLYHAMYCEQTFGRSLLADVDMEQPRFYTEDFLDVLARQSGPPVIDNLD